MWVMVRYFTRKKEEWRNGEKEIENNKTRTSQTYHRRIAFGGWSCLGSSGHLNGGRLSERVLAHKYRTRPLSILSPLSRRWTKRKDMRVTTTDKQASKGDGRQVRAAMAWHGTLPTNGTSPIQTQQSSTTMVRHRMASHGVAWYGPGS